MKNSTITQFNAIVGAAARIAVISHTNPDGDAIGSGLALTLFLREQFPAVETRFFVPNRFPSFLAWIDSEGVVEIFEENRDQATAFISTADVVIAVDVNTLSRVEGINAAIATNPAARTIVIDHHVDPASFDLTISDSSSAATALIVYRLICGAGCVPSTEAARAIYLGIMSDTGCLSFGNLSPELYRAVAHLVECGVDTVAVNRSFFHGQPLSRVKLNGYLVSDKMVVRGQAAYITLTRAEKESFNYQIGDTEGVVNVPLTIVGVRFSALLTETKECIKISLRSVGDLDVNLIARRHFNGGGHRNAAGGKFFDTMEKAVEEVEQVIANL